MSGNPFLERLSALPWLMITLIVGIALFGTAMLYSSTATNPIEAALPAKHAIRFVMAFLVMIGLALTPLSLWSRAAIPVYIGALVLLVGVEFFGAVGGGAQRWLDIGPVRLQPSELMKLALILMLARYYHLVLKDNERRLWHHMLGFMIIIAPAFLVFRQPDLGTALMLVAAGSGVIFFAGLHLRVIIAGIASALVAAPLAYFYVLKDYQRERVLTAINPERDPLGAGYQIQQAKIAIGAGGFQGSGYMQGTQSQLDYIPEQHTDFIFTVIAEELGFVGAFGLLIVWGVIFVMGMNSANRCKTTFGRLAAAGAVVTIAFYVVVNTAMVMGLLPVVGVPLPLVSYGGTAMITVMAAFGLICAVHVDADRNVGGGGIL